MDDYQQLDSVRTHLARLNQEYAAKKGFLSSLDEAIDLTAQVERLQRQIAALNEEYAEKKRFLDDLSSQLPVLEDSKEWHELGLYEPKFTYDSSDAYKAAIIDVISEQKELVRSRRAVTCSTVWRINNSVKAGQVATELSIRFTLGAFNNECEAILSRLRWSNYEACARGIEKAVSDINHLKQAENISISPEYAQLKLRQLRLTFEQAQRVQMEKEEARRVREIENERLKSERALERALQETECEQERYRVALAQARQEAGVHDSAKLNKRIADLESRLALITEQRERALSMAQLTRSGYVYVISNVGSFGEAIFKVGMTRRLEPMERIRELGDASVPFAFDVHAIIWTTDAPTLEAKLHQKLHCHRTNKVNFRKEFFSADVQTVRRVILECAPEATFDVRFEAGQFRASSDPIDRQPVFPSRA